MSDIGKTCFGKENNMIEKYQYDFEKI